MKSLNITPYSPSDAVIRAEWTGETVEQAQAAIDAESAESAVSARNLDNVLARLGLKRWGS